MKELRKINIEDYNYDLPEERIAQYPEKERDTSRLLLYNKGIISEDTFRNIDKYITAESLLVFNNTKVIRARLLFQKKTGANIEVFCIEPLKPVDYQQSFSSADPVEWKCIVGNLKKWKTGNLSMSFVFSGKLYELSAQKLGEEGEAWRIRFSWSAEGISFGEVIEAAGHIPLPPYVKREDESEDNIRYQTVYSRVDGSVAAPTAGLHFTNEILENIREKGIKSAELTLHVGAGTFQPVRTNDITEHDMHCEHFFITRKLLEELLCCRGRIIAVGTTSVRTLESIYRLGVKAAKNQIKPGDEFSVGQWEPYDETSDISMEDSLESLLAILDKRNLRSLQGSTRIIIVPGYKFRIVDGMITNFHQPRSTLLLLVSAWIGQDWKKIYSYALEKSFRFLSFGDSSLLLK